MSSRFVFIFAKIFHWLPSYREPSIYKYQTFSGTTYLSIYLVNESFFVALYSIFR